MSRDTPDTLDLDALAVWCRNHNLAAWCRSDPRGERIASNAWFGPSALMRQPWNLTRNAAASALEALEARGVLERIPGQALAWKLAPAPPSPIAATPAALEILSKALLKIRIRAARSIAGSGPRTAERRLAEDVQECALDALRLADATAASSYSPPLSPAERAALLRLLDDDLRMGPRGPDAATLRSLRSKLLRKEKP